MSHALAQGCASFAVINSRKIFYRKLRFGMILHYGFCELNTELVMERNLKSNGLYATLAHHLNKGILLAQLLVKVVNLCFKLLYLRAQLCYKRLVISNWTW